MTTRKEKFVESLSGMQIVFANTNAAGFLTELIVADVDGTQYFLHVNTDVCGTCIVVEDESYNRMV